MNNLSTSGVTNQGLIRDKNEDDYLIQTNEFNILAVADGMGGHQGGEVASSMAINFIEDFNWPQSEDIEDEIVRLIREVNNKIIQQGFNNLELKGMGTTLTMGVVTSDQLFYGHIGDSRLYLYREGSFKRITTDHSLVNKLLEENKITPGEAFDHPQRNILTQAIGLEKNIEIEVNSFKILPGDIILLCTDGLTDMVREEQIKEVILNNYPNIEDINQKLLNEAIEAGGKDNITIITGIIA
ncbi:MAG: Stp1/IreP family PP2C-type Ser/Thr phosphatase [Bacillota bacterium]